MLLPRPALRWLSVALFCAVSVGCTPRFISLTRQGDVLYKKEDLEGARTRYVAALKNNPKYAPALVKLGLIDLEDELWDKAEKTLTAAIQADPMMVEGYRGRGMARLHLGRYDAAGTDFKKALELGSTNAHFGLGLHAYLTDDFDDAFTNLGQAFKEGEDSVEVATYVLKTAIASGNYKQGRALLKEAPVPEDEAEAADIVRMDTDLAYLDKDFPAALEAQGKTQDKLAFGFWFREPSAAARGKMGSLGGAVVDFLHLGSPTAMAGIQPSDVVVSFERKPIRSAADLYEAISAYEDKASHEEALIEVVRDGQQLAFRVMPGKFKTRQLIDQTAAGGENIPLTMAPNALMEFP